MEPVRAWLAFLFWETLALLLFQLALGYSTGSLTLIADSAHSSVDVIAYGLNYAVEVLKSHADVKADSADGITSVDLADRIDSVGAGVSVTALILATAFVIKEAVGRLFWPEAPGEDEHGEDEHGIGPALFAFAVVSTLGNLLALQLWQVAKNRAAKPSEALGKLAANPDSDERGFMVAQVQDFVGQFLPPTTATATPAPIPVLTPASDPGDGERHGDETSVPAPPNPESDWTRPQSRRQQRSSTRRDATHESLPDTASTAAVESPPPELPKAAHLEVELDVEPPPPRPETGWTRPQSRRHRDATTGKGGAREALPDTTSTAAVEPPPLELSKAAHPEVELHSEPLPPPAGGGRRTRPLRLNLSAHFKGSGASRYCTVVGCEDPSCGLPSSDGGDASECVDEGCGCAQSGSVAAMFHSIVHPGCQGHAGGNLNATSALLHLISDVFRGVVIFITSIIISFGAVLNAERADAICALAVSGFVILGAGALFQKLCASHSARFGGEAGLTRKNQAIP